MSFRNKLACHFFHSGQCSKNNCKFLHEPNPSLGYCPNSDKCPIYHNEIQCPSLKKNTKCKIPHCAYYHPEPPKKFQNVIIIDKFNPTANLGEVANCKELEKHIKGLNKDLSSLLPIENKLMKIIDLDIMFIMDCTGSMSQWIDASKKELNNIIDCIQEQHYGIKPRISFVA